MSNQSTWRDKEIVEEYARATELQAPERAILELLRDRLPEMKMLDIGVGGGRTTGHFAPLVKEYIGIDYSEEMIAACKLRYLHFTRVSFAVCDARAMSIFADETFDFILFSFNGIDYITHQDRLRVFAEVRRVGRPGALFYFSTHNLQALQNFEVHNQITHALINDGVHNGRLETYYVRPADQLKQLKGLFEDIRVYSLSTGEVIHNCSDLEANDEAWLYYSCLIWPRAPHVIYLLDSDCEKL
jgi:ubiquinone/menaquinone biosynthesis C-methylase UbiE